MIPHLTHGLQLQKCLYAVMVFFVGVLNSLMYAIGGYDERRILKSVEVYRPSDGVWYFIADMQFPRYRPSN